MFDESRCLKIAKVFNIGVYLHWTVAFTAVLVFSSVGFQILPSFHPEWGFFEYLAASSIGTVLFFFSIVAHEYGHSITAQKCNISVRSITLFALGGVAVMEKEAERPWHDFLISAAGPLVSFGLGFTGLFLFQFTIPAEYFTHEDPSRAIQSLSMFTTLAFLLGIMNTMLGLFNLLPAFPMDGGKILRSVIWGATGNYSHATRWSAYVGMFFAGALFTFGVLQMFSGNPGGLMMMLVGGFIFMTAYGISRAY